MENRILNLGLASGGNSHDMKFEYKTVIICNDATKEEILNNNKMSILEPYIVLTDNTYIDNKIDIFENVDLNKLLLRAVVRRGY